MLSEVERILTRLKGEDVVYVPLRGNAGDSFIVHSTFQLFDRVGLTVKIGHEAGIYPGSIVILAGGGNLVRPYQNGLTFLTNNIDKWKSLIVLPHTIRAYEHIWNQLHYDCVVFCRERPSFDFVKKNTKAAVILSHDVAFSCDLEETRRQLSSRYRRDILNKTLLVRNAKCLVRAGKYLASTGFSSSVLNAYRTDVERANPRKQWPNIDISEAFAVDDMLPAASLYATAWMSKFIGSFKKINTSRLHVGIMSAILGKDVDFYDNSYGKNADVFEHSISERFNNVKWVEKN